MWWSLNFLTLQCLRWLLISCSLNIYLLDNSLWSSLYLLKSLLFIVWWYICLCWTCVIFPTLGIKKGTRYPSARENRESPSCRLEGHKIQRLCSTLSYYRLDQNTGESYSQEPPATIPGWVLQLTAFHSGLKSQSDGHFPS